MARFGLIGPSYQSQSLTADCQVTRNWYVEQLEQPNGKAAFVLYPTPGKKGFATLPGQPVRGEIEINGRFFAVGGTKFCEVAADGTVTPIADIINDLLPASMVASPQQLLIASGGNLYVYWLQTVTGGTNPQVAGTFLLVPPATFEPPNGIRMVEYVDGYFAALVKDSQTIYLSALFDASTWKVLGVPQTLVVSVFSDNVQSIIENQRRLYVQGRKRSTVYYNSGSSRIFDVDPSGTSENGSVAVFGVVRADNSIFWIDQDERGSGVVRRMSGYTPVRISNHAIEFAIQGYATISDASAYSYQDQGHTFIQWRFPTANKTWDYDVATNMWHERAFYNVATGLYSADKSQNHCFAFGKHLLGDPLNGNIYESSINIYTDAGGALIRRVRRSPHISTENKFTFYNELVLDFETGLGPMPPLLDGAGVARGPQVTLRWSKDYAHTWSNEYDLDAGQAGQFRQRVRKSRMGRARDMVFEITVSDPIPWRLIEGYLDADGPAPFKPQQRLVSKYTQVT